MRTYAYIDGFNLYYGALKDTAFKWLDLGVLIPLMLGHKHDVACIKYFTAKVKVSETDPRQSERQETYLRALREPRDGIPPVEIHFGHFQRRSTRMPRSPFGTGWVEVIKTEEKGSDVNLAVHLLNDAWLDAYECAVVVSNDSDLAEAMRLARGRGKVIGFIPPAMKRGAGLRRCCASIAISFASFGNTTWSVPKCRPPSQGPVSTNPRPGRHRPPALPKPHSVRHPVTQPRPQEAADRSRGAADLSTARIAGPHDPRPGSPLAT